MLSFTIAYLIDALTRAITNRFLRSMHREIGFPQESTTPIYEYNDPTIDIVNCSIPVEITRHINLQLFYIQVWKESGDIIMHNIPRIINPSDDLNKPLVWVSHYRHYIYLMRHYNISFG